MAKKAKKQLIPTNVVEAILLAIPAYPRPGLKVYDPDADHLIKGSGYVIRKGVKMQFSSDKFKNCCADSNAPLDRVNKMMDCFMSPMLLTHADGESVKELFRYCSEAAEDLSLIEKTVFTVGFGASEKMPSARLAAYILPALRIMENFQNAGFPVPRLRILSGAQLGLHMNEFCQESVLASMAQTFRILKKFVHDFFPELEKQVFFDQDLSPEKVLEKIEPWRDKWIEGIDSSSSEYKVLRALASCGVNNRCAAPINGASKYALSHPLLFGDVSIADCPATEWEAENENNDLIFISLGGHPERLFNFFRNYFPESTVFNGAARRRSIKLIVDVGKKPVYYPISGEPIFGELRSGWLKAALKNPSFKKNRILPDFEALPAGYEDWAIDIKF